MLDPARGFSVSLDLQQIAQLLLFNLMGHLATRRAALWLMPCDGSRAAVLLRSLGFDRALLRKEMDRTRARSAGLGPSSTA